ncbi:DUF2254 domain-containing protein [Moraxella nasovis]|uniref:DUF2254 domain-containing protein n=1 Tax=Moraxella nasovis TaxID=2904121 RepID=UPI001F60F980|nr:DUF2254 family protein [Moraxella nasovis]UNU73523.1 DUF2254 domain-containing protein [Moraxella nasovis]
MITNKLQNLKLWLKDPAQNLWVQPALGAIFALIFSLLAKLANRFMNSDGVPKIAPETLYNLLNIIASSMLAVTTFSLSIMVSALASTASGTSPRARLLLVADRDTRIAITSFISAFIYAIIAKIALGMQYYGIAGRFVLFISTICVLIYLIITLIRWVQTLSQLGSFGDTINKIETIASRSLASHRNSPNLGLLTAIPDGAIHFFNVTATKSGYISYISLEDLHKITEEYGLHLHICHRVGDFVEPNETVFQVFINQPKQRLDDQFKTSLAIIQHKISKKISHEFTLRPARGYGDDPRFGILVLSEVGQKSMSAAINDPASTALTLDAITRILIDTKPSDEQISSYKNLSIVPLNIKEFLNPVFMPIAKDAHGDLDVNIHLLKCLDLIARHAPEYELKLAATRLAQKIYDRAMAHLSYDADKAELQRLYTKTFTPNNLHVSSVI